MLAPLVSLLVALDLVAAAAVNSNKRFLAVATHEERARVPSGWVQRTNSALTGRSLETPQLDKKAFRMYVLRPAFISTSVQVLVPPLDAFADALSTPNIH